MKKLLIDLDSILDPKIGSSFILNREFTIGLMANGYQNRINDSCFYRAKSKEAWENVYKNRDTLVLQNTLRTNIFQVISKLAVSEITDELESNGIINELDVNYFPYYLTEEELRDLELCILECSGIPIRINWIRKDPKAFSTKSLSSLYDVVIMHDLLDFLRLKNEDIITSLRQDCIYVGPRILPEDHKGFTREELKKSILEKEPDLNNYEVIEKVEEVFIRGPFGMLEEFLYPFIHIEFIDTYFFSIGGKKEG